MVSSVKENWSLKLLKLNENKNYFPLFVVILNIPGKKKDKQKAMTEIEKAKFKAYLPCLIITTINIQFKRHKFGS